MTGGESLGGHLGGKAEGLMNRDACGYGVFSLQQVGDGRNVFHSLSPFLVVPGQGRRRIPRRDCQSPCRGC